MTKPKGLSSDCKLPPEIAIGLQLNEEYPCDRCNVDRQTCRGEPRKKFNVKKLDYIRVMIEPMDHCCARNPVKRFRVKISIDGKTYGLEEIYAEDEIKPMFDRIWESAGRQIKQAINNTAQRGMEA